MKIKTPKVKPKLNATHFAKNYITHKSWKCPKWPPVTCFHLEHHDERTLEMVTTPHPELTLNTFWMAYQTITKMVKFIKDLKNPNSWDSIHCDVCGNEE